MDHSSVIFIWLFIAQLFYFNLDFFPFILFLSELVSQFLIQWNNRYFLALFGLNHFQNRLELELQVGE